MRARERKKERASASSSHRVRYKLSRRKFVFSLLFIGGSSGGSDLIMKAAGMHDVKSCLSACESELQMPVIPAMPKSAMTTLTTGGGGSNGNNSGSNSKRSNGSRSRSSGSEQSVQTGTGSGGGGSSGIQSSSTLQHQQQQQQSQQDLSGSRQSFRIAMGNPCEFFVDVM